ncbi:MAG: flagellar export chaperone FliS [Vicinamibacterales bacterium]
MTTTPQNRGANVYYQTHVQSRSPLELVVMLYDGALRFLRETHDAMARRDLVTKARTLSRALAIVSELQNNLNFDAAPEVSQQLDDLYTYMTSRLVEANMKGDPAIIAEVVHLLETVREAWAEVAGRPSVAA